MNEASTLRLGSSPSPSLHSRPVPDVWVSATGPAHLSETNDVWVPQHAVVHDLALHVPVDLIPKQLPLVIRKDTKRAGTPEGRVAFSSPQTPPIWKISWCLTDPTRGMKAMLHRLATQQATEGQHRSEEQRRILYHITVR